MNELQLTKFGGALQPLGCFFLLTGVCRQVLQLQTCGTQTATAQVLHLNGLIISLISKPMASLGKPGF